MFAVIVEVQKQIQRDVTEVKEDLAEVWDGLAAIHEVQAGAGEASREDLAGVVSGTSDILARVRSEL